MLLFIKLFFDYKAVICLYLPSHTEVFNNLVIKIVSISHQLPCLQVRISSQLPNTSAIL